MKQIHLTLMTLLTALLCGAVSARGETVTDYTVDFNTRIDTSTHNFKVASNWDHQVGSGNYDGYGPYYMDYTWYETNEGRTGVLSIPKQFAGDYGGGDECTDVLITPEVSGTLTFVVKTKNSASYLSLYALDESGRVPLKSDNTPSTQPLKKFTSSQMGGGSDWQTVTFDVTEQQKIGIRASEIYLDEFKASSAEIALEPGLTITSAVPSETSGTIYFDEQSNGKVLVKYTVTVKNTGQTVLTTGDKNYTVSIINGSTSQPIAGPTAVPQTLAVGETSEPFDVIAEVTPSDVWSYSSDTKRLNLRENITKTVVQRAHAGYRAYEPKFVFRVKGTTSSSNVTACDFGIVSEETTKEYEIANTGAAPLTVKSVTLPEGFNVTAPTGEFVLNSNETSDVTITMPAGQVAAFSNPLTVVYLDKASAEKTFTMPVAGKCANGKWYTDFNGSSAIEYPAGSVVEAGLTSAEQYSTALGKTNYYLKSWTNSDYADANNKFITPKLHAEAGDKVFFDVARDVNGETSAVKVYVSKDRENWGEPLKTLTYADFADGEFKSESIQINEAGDYYIGFATFGMKLDDIIGLDKVAVAHDIYYTEFTQTEEVQTGGEVTATVKFLPLTAARISDYTIKYVVDGEATQLDSKALSANSKNATTFTHKFNPESDVTKTIKGHFEIEFRSGEKFVSPERETKVTCQPDFVFFKKDSYGNTSYLPDSEKQPLDFGKTNAKASKEYEIYNWGKAPLHVKSITLPEGYSAQDDEGNAVSECTVAGKARQAVNIVFTATEAGTYSGNLEIVYTDAEGADVTFTLPVSGTMLNPSKFYTNFGSDDDAVTWAPGTVYQKNLSATYTGYSPKDWYLYSTSGTSSADRMFITPKLKAEAGEAFMFDSRKDGWNDAEVKLYISATRQGLADDATRTCLLTMSPASEDEATKLEETMKTFTATVPEAGEYYVGIELANRARLDEVYGLEVVPVDYDLTIAGSELPANAMQNIASTGRLMVNNFGLADLAEGDYTVTVYINGEAMAPQTGVAIPMEHAANATGTVVPVDIRSPKAGTFPVFMELKAGDFTARTEAADVTFAQEVLGAEVVVGDPATNSSSSPVSLNYRNSETLALYTPDLLKLSAGDKISSIVYKGYGDNEWTSNLSFYYKWVDETTLDKPTSSSNYDTTGMTEVLFNNYAWPTGGSSSQKIDKITVNFEQPLVYEAGKSLLILVRSTCSGYKSGHNFEVTASDYNCYQHQNDGTEGILTGSWNGNNLPVLHLSLVVEPRTLSGNVTMNGEAVEGATVTLVSQDGDNVQYEATTGADGAYTLDVIQSSRAYSAHAVKAGAGEEFIDDIYVADESKTLDIVLRPVVTVSDDATHTAGAADAIVYLNAVYEPGFNAVTLPFDLNAEEIAILFGDEVKVYKFMGDDGNAVTPKASFSLVSAMEAGTPYLLYLFEATQPAFFLNKEVASELRTVPGTSLSFVPTAAPTELGEGMFVVKGDNFNSSSINALNGVNALPAYRAYLKGNAGVTNVTFGTDVHPTAVEEIDADSTEDTIYDLNGFRVSKADRGIYIINGKKVMVIK